MKFPSKSFQQNPDHWDGTAEGAKALGLVEVFADINARNTVFWPVDHDLPPSGPYRRAYALPTPEGWRIVEEEAIIATDSGGVRVPINPR